MRYGYDSAGNLTTVTGPDGAVSIIFRDELARIGDLLNYDLSSFLKKN